MVSPKVSVSPVATLDLKGPSANLKEAVQRLLIEKSSLALIGETPSILFQYQSHKDQLKLLPDVLSNSYFALGIKKGTCLELYKRRLQVPTISQAETLQHYFLVNIILEVMFLSEIRECGLHALFYEVPHWEIEIFSDTLLTLINVLI